MRKKLLLVEDDTSVLASLELCLKADYEIHSASTIRSGVDLFKAVRPSLVVLDLRLPDGDGLDALRAIRDSSETIPIVVLTGYASMSSVEEALRLGASDYLHKPFDGFALKSRIDQLTSAAFDGRPDDDQISSSLENALHGISELEFQAHASAMFLHDAASPVTTALTATHILCQAMEGAPDHFSKDVYEAVGLLHNAVGFISGLFEQSRSIEMLRKLKTEEVPVHKIVTLALNLARAKAEGREIKVAVQLENSDAKMRVNQFVLARVLLNLVRNAVEAVQPKTGKVCLSAKATDDYVEFAVLDNGPGIAPRYMQQIFEPRFSTKKGGAGLGLYICKHLVESMTGTFSVRNEPGQGCCFSIRIPRPL